MHRDGHYSGTLRSGPWASWWKEARKVYVLHYLVNKYFRLSLVSKYTVLNVDARTRLGIFTTNLLVFQRIPILFTFYTLLGEHVNTSRMGC